MDPRAKPPDDVEGHGGAEARPASSDSGSSDDGIPRPLDPQSFPATVASFGPAISLSRLPPVARGAYSIEGALAQGGAGKILRARDERLGRTVALKVMRYDPSGPDAERFVREVMITAKLQHPSIVTLYEAGRWPSGEPFYTMELVAGRSLVEVYAERPALADRLALVPHVIDAAEAVAYAHSRGILHRDLKPGNVLVGSFGETVLIDWGLAKDLSRDNPVPEVGAPGHLDRWGLDPPDTLTKAGAVLGTPAYMPPEQANGLPVDERADVYALGAIVYHLVAGAPPYEGRTPMRVIRRVIEGPPSPLEDRQPDAPAELMAIARKAMARDPARRYATARAFADDLRRFENGQKVEAYDYSAGERLIRFTTRHRAPVLVGVAALVILALGGSLGFWRVLSARDEAQRRMRQAEAAQAQAVRHADDLTLVEARAQAVRDPARAVAWLRTLSSGFDRWPAARVIAEDARAHGIATVTDAHAAAVNDLAFSRDGALLATSSDDHAVRMWDVAAGRGWVASGHGDEVWSLLFLGDGRTLASAGKDRTIRLLDLASRESRALEGHEGPVSSMAGSPDGRLLVSGSFDRTLRIWDTVTAKSWALRGPGSEVRTVALSNGRRKVASGRMDGAVQIWDLDRGQERTLARFDAPVLELAFLPDDRTLIAALWNGAVHALRADREGPGTLAGDDRVLGGSIHGYDPTTYHALACSSDGKLLVFAREDGVAVLDPSTLAERTLRVTAGPVTSVALSPDQRLVAAGGADHAVHLWDLETGTARTLHGFQGSGVLVAFSPDGRLLAAAGSEDHEVRLHPVHAAAPSFSAHPGGVSTLRLSPDGRLLLTAGKDGAARLWGLPSGGLGDHPPPAVTLTGHGGAIVAAMAPDGRFVATAGEEGSARLWDTTGRLVRTFEDGGPARAPRVLFSPDGKRIAYAGADGSVRVGEVDTGAVRVFSGHPGGLEALVFSPRGDLLASAGQNGAVGLWPLAGAAEGKTLLGHTGAVMALAFAPDGATLVSGGRDHTLRFWPVAGGAPRVVPVGGGGVQRALFTRDGRTLLYTSLLESAVHQMDVASGKDLALLVAHEGDLQAIALSPDETRVAAATTRGEVRLWDRRTGESRAVSGHAYPAREVVYSPDGRFVISAGDDGAVRFWADDLPEDGPSLRAWLAGAGGAGISALVETRPPPDERP